VVGRTTGRTLSLRLHVARASRKEVHHRVLRVVAAALQKPSCDVTNFQSLKDRRIKLSRSCSDDIGICYVLPVFWDDVMFLIMGRPLAFSIGSIYVRSVLEQVVINFQRIRQVASHCLTS